MQNKKNTWFDRIKDVLGESPKAKEDLLELLKNSAVDGVIDIESLKMIEGVFKVSEIQVREIMIPRSHITVVDISDDITDIIKKVTSSGHSRFPVIDDNKDEIIGVLLAKDLLKRNTVENIDIDLHEVLRPAVFVPESKRLNILLNEFKSSRNHIAIVIDEHGSVSGLITIEDVLEEIVGEIDDEHDEETVSKIISRGNNQYIVDALTPLEEFNSYFLSNFHDEDIETIGGFLINRFEKVPKNSETISIEKLFFKILSADSRSIKRIQVTRTTASK
ncbi:MAG: transporter associated domain-containing protein [Pseudomonadota bacterium]|jgi:magnesium and cobalt transporter|nr:magnesium/cobalt efflux protein [Gammaproteobacteria bacterium]MEC8085498.1 transporter associated domain-containing protein [Pseudomonadota bacterium]|tara:strand:- start:233 stop:1060 length:828 start_codon:yes stop_codon:yes gene_type:complete